jgi:hypothetical protein
MTRVALLLGLAALRMLAGNDEFAPLFNGRDLEGWTGDSRHWSVLGGVLVGRSDGESAQALMVSGRQYGDFELRLDMRVNRGAARVQMRGPGAGPLGVALEIGTRVVRWMSNGSEALVAFPAKAGLWDEYRVIVKGSEFQFVQNGVPCPFMLASPHVAASGKLGLVLPAGERSEVEVRNVRIRAL